MAHAEGKLLLYMFSQKKKNCNSVCVTAERQQNDNKRSCMACMASCMCTTYTSIMHVWTFVLYMHTHMHMIVSVALQSPYINWDHIAAIRLQVHARKEWEHLKELCTLHFWVCIMITYYTGIVGIKEWWDCWLCMPPKWEKLRENSFVYYNVVKLRYELGTWNIQHLKNLVNISAPESNILAVTWQ